MAGTITIEEISIIFENTNIFTVIEKENEKEKRLDSLKGNSTKER